MSYSDLQKIFAEVVQPKTCWGADSVRNLLNGALDQYQAQHGRLETAGIIVNVMVQCVKKKRSWGNKELQRLLAFAIRQAEEKTC